MYTQIMAKTIMISNDVYNELKRIKSENSFTEVIHSLMAKSKRKTGAGLKECLGLLDKNDKEYDEVMKELKGLYKKWTQKYA